jgi:hypothetical protein
MGSAAFRTGAVGLSGSNVRPGPMGTKVAPDAPQAGRGLQVSCGETKSHRQRRTEQKDTIRRESAAQQSVGWAARGATCVHRRRDRMALGAS